MYSSFYLTHITPRLSRQTTNVACKPELPQGPVGGGVRVKAIRFLCPRSSTPPPPPPKKKVGEISYFYFLSMLSYYEYPVVQLIRTLLKNHFTMLFAATSKD